MTVTGEIWVTLDRQGRVSTVVVPQADAATLMRESERRALKGAVFYTDRFSSYKSLRRYGQHRPVDHGQTYGQRGRHYLRHINGIEGFWSYAKERLRKYHGVSRLHFPLYLKEMEFRFNHRRDDLFELLGTHLLKVLFEYPLAIPPKEKEALAQDLAITARNIPTLRIPA